MKRLATLFLFLAVGVSMASGQTLRTFVQNGKYGYKNGTSVVVAPKYDYADDFHNGRAAVQLQGKWGFIDSTGTVIVNPSYDRVESFRDGCARFYVGKKFGLLGLNGKEIVPAICDDAFVHDGAIVYTSDKKKGWLNPETGKMAPAVYDEINVTMWFVEATKSDETFDVYLKEGKLIAESMWMHSEILRSNWYSDIVDVYTETASKLFDKWGKQVGKDYGGIINTPVSYYEEVSEDGMSHYFYSVLLCYHLKANGEQSEEFDVFTLGGKQLPGGPFTSFELSYLSENSFAIVVAKDMAYRVDFSTLELVPFAYKKAENMYDYLLLYRMDNTVEIARIPVVSNYPELFLRDTSIVAQFSSVSLLLENNQNMVYVDPYNPYYLEDVGVTFNYSRIVEVEGLGENKGKYALYSLFREEMLTPYDNHRKQLVEYDDWRNQYVYADEQGRIGAYLDGKIVDYRYASVEEIPYQGYLFTDTLDKVSFYDMNTKKLVEIPAGVKAQNSTTYLSEEPFSYFDEETGEEYWVTPTPRFYNTFVLLTTETEPKKLGLINTRTEIIAPTYDSLMDDMDYVVQESPDMIIATYKNGKYGAYNLSKCIEIPNVYDSLIKFQHGYAGELAFSYRNKEECYLSSTNKKYHSMLFEPEVKKVGKYSGMFEYNDFSEKDELVEVIPARYKAFRFDGEMYQFVFAQGQDNKWGILTIPVGDTFVPLQYDNLEMDYDLYDGTDASEYFIRSTLKKKQGIISAYNAKAIPALYDNIEFDGEAGMESNVGFFIVHKGDKAGLYNVQLNELLPCEFDGINVRNVGGSSYVFAQKADKVYAVPFSIFTVDFKLTPRNVFDYIVGNIGYRVSNNGYDAYDLSTLDYVGSAAQMEIIDVGFEGGEYTLIEENGLLGLKDPETNKVMVKPQLRIIEFEDVDYLLTFDKGMAYYNTIGKFKSRAEANKW